jgi:hypothetical protein
VISGIVHVLQSGCRWKDAPAIYGIRNRRAFRLDFPAHKSVGVVVGDGRVAAIRSAGHGEEGRNTASRRCSTPDGSCRRLS